MPGAKGCLQHLLSATRERLPSSMNDKFRLSDERKVRNEDRHRKSNATEQTRSENMMLTLIQRQFANAQSNGYGVHQCNA
jgi:hypothetical protein